MVRLGHKRRLVRTLWAVSATRLVQTLRATLALPVAGYAAADAALMEDATQYDGRARRRDGGDGKVLVF